MEKGLSGRFERCEPGSMDDRPGIAGVPDNARYIISWITDGKK